MSTASVSFVQAPTGSEAPASDPTKDINASATNPDTSPERPSWLPDNHKTVEDFVKATNATQAELTRTQQELARIRKGEKPADGDAPEKKADPLKIEDGKTQDEAAADAVSQAGLDVSKWQEEFNTSQDVSEDGRAEIAKGLEGIFGENARQIVDDYIDSKKTLHTNTIEASRKQIFDIAGGEDKYGAMMQWAATNLSDAEQTAYNKAMDSMDINAQSLAVDGLKARFVKANGNSPSLINGDNSIGNDAAGFASTFEMTKAMGDPRYKSDPVYRKSVEQKAMKSNW